MKTQIRNQKSDIQNRRSAFTLVEMLLVVTIIGILAALVIPKIVGRSEQARITAAQTDINAGIKTALDAFEVDNGFYPRSLQDLVDAAAKRPELARAVSGQTADGSVEQSLHLLLSRQTQRQQLRSAVRRPRQQGRHRR